MTGQQEREHLLRESELTVEGVLRDASNLTLRVLLGPPGDPAPAGNRRAVYKPVRGERPLHDFAPGTLAGREVAAYLLSTAGGWDLVPLTLLRDGPLGPGAVQWWVDQPPELVDDPGAGVVDLRAPAELEQGWLPVVQVQDQTGAPLVVAHADDPDTASLAVLDAVLNNADRKGSHLLRDTDGRLWGIDHGVCLHHDEKLRTVLWGWAGDPLPARDLDRLAVLQQQLAQDSPLSTALAALLAPREVEALRRRVGGLLDQGTFPLPPVGRYPLPWPLW